MPRYPAAGSTLAKTMNRSASSALVIQSLRPVRTQSPVGACRVARDASAKASLPDPASDSAYAPTDADASRGR